MESKINFQERSKEIGKRSLPKLKLSQAPQTVAETLKKKMTQNHVSMDNKWNPTYWNQEQFKKLPKQKNINESFDISYWRKKFDSLSSNNRQFDVYINQIESMEGRANEKKQNCKSPYDLLSEPASYKGSKTTRLMRNKNNNKSESTLPNYKSYDQSNDEKNNEAGFIYGKAAKAKLALQDVLLDDENFKIKNTKRKP